VFHPWQNSRFCASDASACLALPSSIMTIDVSGASLHFYCMKAKTRMAHATVLVAYRLREVEFGNLNSRIFVFNYNYEQFPVSS
jgi:hypothetical protein